MICGNHWCRQCDTMFPFLFNSSYLWRSFSCLMYAASPWINAGDTESPEKRRQSAQTDLINCCIPSFNAVKLRFNYYNIIGVQKQKVISIAIKCQNPPKGLSNWFCSIQLSQRGDIEQLLMLKQHLKISVSIKGIWILTPCLRVKRETFNTQRASLSLSVLTHPDAAKQNKLLPALPAVTSAAAGKWRD